MMAVALDTARALFRVQALRFLVAGVVNTLFGYFVYLLGLLAGFSPEAALFIATCVGALWNYFTTALYVFNHRGFDRLPLFVATYAVIYGINIVALRAVLLTGLSAALAQAILLPVIAALSFALFRLFVFRGANPS